MTMKTKNNANQNLTPAPKKKGKGSLRFSGMLGSKRFRYGSYSLIVIAVTLVVAVLLNIAVQTLENNLGLRADLTANQLFTLQDETLEYLDEGLNEDVYVYGLYQAGAENPTIQEVLGKYVARNKHVKVEYFDPITNPSKANQFKNRADDELDRGSVVVASADGKKFKVLEHDDMFPEEYVSGKSYYSLRAEQQITSAIMFVMQEITPKAYILQGHEELGINNITEFRKALEDENYIVEEANLTQTPDILTPIDTLIIASPDKDITDEERETIKDFLQAGGRAMFFLDVYDIELPNLQSILELYDVHYNPNYVVEGNENNYIQNKLWLVPQLGVSTITDYYRQNGLRPIVQNSGYFTLPEMKKTDIEVNSLFTTSSSAFAKANISSDLIDAKEDGDFTGPFTTAVSILHDNFADDIQTRIVAFGTSAILEESLMSVSYNYEIMLDAIAWMDPAKESTNIRMRNLQVQSLNITSAAQMYGLMGFVAILMPVIAFVGALVVYLKRRHL